MAQLLCGWAVWIKPQVIGVHQSRCASDPASEFGDGYWIDDNRKFIRRIEVPTLTRHGALPAILRLQRWLIQLLALAYFRR